MRTLFAAAVVVSVLASVSSGDRASGSANMSATKAGCGRTVVFWAWERSEDLRFLNSSCTAVAWFGGHVDLDSTSVRFRPREQTLRLPPGEANWPVLRVDASGDPPSGVDEMLRRADFVRAATRFLAAEHLANGLQIDFDAPRSWRGFYRDLLSDVRTALPDDAPLTITALASWCLGDPWLRDMSAISDAVPMLFRMGPDAAGIRRELAAGRSFRAAQCRGSVGVSIDEPIPQRAVRESSRVYVFAPEPWTRQLADRAYGVTGVGAAPRSKNTRP